MTTLHALFVLGMLGLVRSEYYQIYDGQWPHCSNADCFNGLQLSDVEAKCDNLGASCFGFSLSSGAAPYSGCWKVDSAQCVDEGFGVSSVENGDYDFYIADDNDDGVLSGFVQVWTDKWPNCDNLACPSYTVDEMKIACQKDDACIGFSSNGVNGCLKFDSGTCAANGFASGEYGYYAKVGSFCADGCAAAANELAFNVEMQPAAVVSMMHSINVAYVLAFLALANLVYMALIYHGKQRTQSKAMGSEESAPLL